MCTRVVYTDGIPNLTSITCSALDDSGAYTLQLIAKWMAAAVGKWTGKMWKSGFSHPFSIHFPSTKIKMDDNFRNF